MIAYLRWLAPLAVMLLYALLYLFQPPLLLAARAAVFDFYVAQRPRAYDPNLPVRIVDIDDESLEKLGQWPWPRTRTARLIDALRTAGAKVIAFDVVFADPDRTSLSRLLPDLAADFAANNIKFDAGKIIDAPDNDLILAQTVAKGKVVTGFAFLGTRTGELPESKSIILMNGGDAAAHLMHFPGVLKTLALIEGAAEGNGAFSAIPDADGVIRLLPLAYSMKGALYPSLAAEALRIYSGASAITVQVRDAHPVWRFLMGGGIESIRIGEYSVPTDEKGRIRLYDSASAVSRYLPAWEVLAGETDPDELAGAIVFIGTSAMGLGDIRATPLERAVPGVEVHAQIAEQILTGHYLVQPVWGDRDASAVFVLFSVLICIASGRKRIGRASLLLVAGEAILFGGSVAAFRYYSLLIDPVLPGVGLAAVLGIVAAIGYAGAVAERQRVRSAFNRYLAPAAIDRLVLDPGQLKLGGEMRTMTFMFSDIRGFTTISERLDPEELTRFINRFLTPMTNAILETGGTIDKYMGDCIMAFWNAPLDDPDHAQNACRAALKMLRALDDLNSELDATMPGMRLAIGIGINSGPCCVGNLGSEYRFDYSVLGNDVNIASRLEGQSKAYSLTALVGENAHALAPHFAMLELDQIMVKGKTVPITVWGLLGDAALQTDPEFAGHDVQHARMLSCYRAQDWPGAGLIAAALGKSDIARRLGLTEFYQLYMERIAAYMATPPGAAWDGVYVALSK
ncbi:MAG: adenylate/guanylate cyclase domain-containing protein [Alphaproteobacteria bacterium]